MARGSGVDRNGIYVEIGKPVRMWVGPGKHERKGTVLHALRGSTTMTEDETGTLFTRPTDEVEIILPGSPT